jgi:hypothetical protein
MVNKANHLRRGTVGIEPTPSQSNGRWAPLSPRESSTSTPRSSASPGIATAGESYYNEYPDQIPGIATAGESYYNEYHQGGHHSYGSIASQLADDENGGCVGGAVAGRPLRRPRPPTALRVRTNSVVYGVCVLDAKRQAKL